MTRQKKEIIRKIVEIQNWIDVEIELGCGMAPAGTYDWAYQEIEALEEELAHLSHYESAMDMFFDQRGMKLP